jgi:phospholipid/cholesterol/gamma-HCH transport system ATP-binding protein
MSATVPVVSMRGVVTRFGRNLVHDGVDLDIVRGEIVALVGGSGSGKTTLLRHLIGLTRPAAGRIELFGEALDAGSAAERKARKRRFGVLFQHGALFSAFSVGENIGFPLKELGIATADEIHDLVALKLAMVEMEPEHARLMPAELSGGMVKRAALARALALEPELLLLDEPTAGLDPDRSAAFVELIRSLQGELGLTVVLVTHDLDTLAALASKVAVLAERRILSYAGLDETLEVEHPFIQRFFRGEHGSRAHARRHKDD